MISNQILQTTLDGLKAITRIDLGICDTEGKVLASTFTDAEESESSILVFVDSPADSQVIQGYQFFKVFDEHQLEYILLAKGASDDVYMVGKLAAFQIQNLLVAYKERFDKDNFIKNLLLDNLLLVDIYNRAKKLHIETDVKRVVYIIETHNEKDVNALETVRSLFASKTKDFITAVDEKNIILVKEVRQGESYGELDKTANTILDMMNTEAMTKVRVSYGTVINDIKEVSRSYKEAKMALDVGRIFYANKNVIAYSNLGIGRLIYQLPIPLCKMFIREVFDGKSPDEFDEETLATINKFFENSLNVSETSRQLYIHRNTLVYRLDKLQKSTGLDLRVFEDAITFKIALKDLSLTIDDGEFAFIVGRSGSGKSTLLKLLLKELEPTSGRIVVNDMDLGKMPRRYVPKYRRKLGVVFQDFRLLKDLTVFENVAFAQRVIGVPGRVIRDTVPEMLRLVGLSAKYKAYPAQLSGGEQQRVAIARALINRPEVLLADEPTGNLDSFNAHEIMHLLEEINQRGTTMIVVTHSHEMVQQMKKRVITMERGAVIQDEGGSR